MNIDDSNKNREIELTMVYISMLYIVLASILFRVTEGKRWWTQIRIIW
jgi:hypothetical protein